MNRQELKDAWGKLYGELYWSQRNPQWFKDKPVNREHHQIMITVYESMWDRGEYEPETNDRGNTIERSSWPGGDRYHFDFKQCTPAKGWKQYDTSQDASYFGVWVNKEKRETLTYCEGDIIRVICPTAESFKAELDDMERCYGPPPPAFRVYGADGSKILIYDERPTA